MSGVEYTVKELLDRIERKVDAIDNKLELKADRERVHDLASRIAAIELGNAARLPLVEQFREAQQDIEALQVWRNRLVGASGLAFFIGAAAFARAVFGIG